MNKTQGFLRFLQGLSIFLKYLYLCSGVFLLAVLFVSVVFNINIAAIHAETYASYLSLLTSAIPYLFYFLGFRKIQKCFLNPSIEGPRQISTQYFFISLVAVLFCVIPSYISKIDQFHLDLFIALIGIIVQIVFYSGLFVYLKRSKRVFDYFGTNYAGSFFPLYQRKTSLL